MQQYPIIIAQNWNGALLNDAFRMVKPEHHDHTAGAIFEVREHSMDGISLGHAKIISVAVAEFHKVNDNISYSICNRPAPYLKTILQRMFHFTDASRIHIITLQWTERCLEAHRGLLLTHWDKIVNTTPHGASSQFSSVQLSITNPGLQAGA